MQKWKNFLVAGGDGRQMFTADKLKREGMGVALFGFDGAETHRELLCGRASFADAAEHADALILPLPVTRNGELLNAPFAGRHIPLAEILDGVRPHQRIFCGMLKPGLEEELLARGALVYDYFEREELAVRNAVPTAEGVLKIAIEETPVTLHGSRCGVIGYGRTARVIAHLLKAVDASVTVTARKYGDLAWAQAMGCDAVPFDALPQAAARFDVLVNTVPAPVIGEAVLSVLPAGCLVIEIASAPGGIDLEAAQRAGVRVVHASSLPGKVAPKTAGEIISDTILNIYKEEET